MVPLLDDGSGRGHARSLPPSFHPPPPPPSASGSQFGRESRRGWPECCAFGSSADAKEKERIYVFVWWWWCNGAKICLLLRTSNRLKREGRGDRYASPDFAVELPNDRVRERAE